MTHSNLAKSKGEILTADEVNRLLAADGSGDFSITNNSLIISNLIVTDGGTIGQAEGPLLTFDDTNNNLLITGCNVGIGTSSPKGRFDVNIVTLGGTDPSLIANGSFVVGDGSTDWVTLFGKANGTNAPGLSLMGLSNDTNNRADMELNVRETDNTTFSTLTTAAFQFQIYTTNLLTILRNGNVGIGTSPSDLLHVEGSGATIRLVASNDGGSCEFKMYADRADDNADLCKFSVADGGLFSFSNYSTGSWVSPFKIEAGAPANSLYVDSVGALLAGTSTPGNMAAGQMLLAGGVLAFAEITTPMADTNYGKVYTKTDNKLYFQDGAGIEHEIAFV